MKNGISNSILFHLSVMELMRHAEAVCRWRGVDVSENEIKGAVIDAISAKMPGELLESVVQTDPKEACDAAWEVLDKAVETLLQKRNN